MKQRKIRPYLAIVVTTDKKQGILKEEFLYDGRYGINGECMLFPSKDQRDWNKWQRPFIDGDIVFCYDTIAIFKEWGDETLFRTYVIKYLCSDSLIDINTPLFGKGIRKEIRFATEEEKQKLFDAIKANGYKWNDKAKALEKLIIPKFKVGDIVQDKDGYKVKITEVNITKENIITEIKDTHYILDDELALPFINQDNYELIPNKFDPKTLKPFDKVLVRFDSCNNWYASFFSHIDNLSSFCYKFVTTSGKSYKQIIPYNEETKHLLGTNNQAPEFYIY